MLAKSLCAASALILTTGTAFAADFEFGDDASGPSGVLSIWGGGTFPHGMEVVGLEDCDSGREEMCDNSLAAGGYAGALVPFSSGGALYADVTFEMFGEQNSDEADRDDDGIYGALGLHYISAGPNPWGVFGMVGGGSNHADDDTAGPFGGIGVEKAFGNAFLQFGGIVGLRGEDADDTLEDLYFVGGGHTADIGSGQLETSLFYGEGDLDEGAADAPSTWAQIGLTYSAPMGDSGVNWFAGYRGDFLEVREQVNETERVYHQTVSVGITIPIGGAQSPFRTPNLTVPVVNTGEFN